jgi:hypothetical protein
MHHTKPSNDSARREALVRQYLDEGRRDAREMLRDPAGWVGRRLLESAQRQADLHLTSERLASWNVRPLSVEERPELITPLVFERDLEEFSAHLNGSPPNGRAREITASEANFQAREILQAEPDITIRSLADRIGCSIGLVSGLSAWRAVQDARRAGRRPREKPTDPSLLDSLIADQTADAAAAARRPRGRVRRTA